jgi:hypothetical protein
MADIIKGVAGSRTHIRSPLMRESLMDKRVMAATDTVQVLPLLPDVNIVSLGGRSIIDRGPQGRRDESTKTAERFQGLLA